MAGFKISVGKRAAHVSKPEKLEQLTEDLKDKDKFAQFAKDPKKFVGKYGVKIDAGVSNRLKRSLAGAESVSDLTFKEEAALTVAAVASGRAAIASTRVAVVV